MVSGRGLGMFLVLGRPRDGSGGALYDGGGFLSGRLGAGLSPSEKFL